MVEISFWNLSETKHDVIVHVNTCHHYNRDRILNVKV